ncbi:phosphate ABC transporter permease subunit PstC [Methanolobus sediminis]|uniref:Phosphate transport system permease protein n=1 Tax=Methanolobus sediminis TaxID=3072978 RepID=A0AA51YLF1_9EURY|nr:phosphate ABC transporter permease subunit PstC [Methanolobus sediminis]WMW24914.1 phosphate ABC transporter permease subunit PstC [Methanolobus sediminis]
MKTDIRSAIAQIVFTACGIITAITVLYLIGFIFYMAFPVLKSQGTYFIVGDVWNYTNGIYGAKIFIIGTLAVTFVTIILAFPLGIFTSIFLAEFAPEKLAYVLRSLVELLVGIPSVVYGIFGFVVLSKFMMNHVKPLISGTLGFIPIFYDTQPSSGDGVLLASMVLAVMILPTIVALSENAIRSVPAAYREASYAVGATHWETVRKVVIPSASGGIMASLVLGTMRAMGETMAVVMLLGNSAGIPTSIFSSGYAMTSKILNDAGERMANAEHMSALFAIAAVLFLIEILFVFAARKLEARF